MLHTFFFTHNLRQRLVSQLILPVMECTEEAALLPHSKKVLGLNPTSGRGLFAFACSPYACVGSCQLPATVE